MKTRKDIKEECFSYELLKKSGLIQQVSAGIYNYHHILYKSIRKLENLIRQEMESIGYQEMILSIMQKESLWKETGRWDSIEELFNLKNKKDQTFCLAGTNEESIVDFIRNSLEAIKLNGYKFFQIQTKFRDEIRAKCGLIRSKEFIMKDVYSFSSSEKNALTLYDQMLESYHRIFKKIELDYIMIESHSGEIGGSKNHEFQIIADIGDDDIAICENCDFKANKELVSNKCRCGNDFVWKKGVELGHCFYLGQEYSNKMNLKKEKEHLYMNCFGIGISRMIQAILEQHSDKNGMIWNENISAYKVHLMHIGDSYEYGEKVYKVLKSKGIEVFWDDRKISAGKKFYDMDLLGFTNQVIVNSKLENQDKIEFRLRKNKISQIIYIKDILSFI